MALYLRSDHLKHIKPDETLARWIYDTDQIKRPKWRLFCLRKSESSLSCQRSACSQDRRIRKAGELFAPQMKRLLGIAEVDLEVLEGLGFTCVPSPLTHIIRQNESESAEALLLHASVDVGHVITAETPIPPDIKEKLERLAEHAKVKLYDPIV